MRRLEGPSSVEKLSSFFDTFFNLIEHQVGSCPIERDPGMKPGVLCEVNLKLDFFLHVERFLWFFDLQVAVAAFCKNAAHAMKDIISSVTVFLFQVGGDGLCCVNGPLKSQRIPMTCIGTSKIGHDEGCYLPACTKRSITCFF